MSICNFCSLQNNLPVWDFVDDLPPTIFLKNIKKNYLDNIYLYGVEHKYLPVWHFVGELPQLGSPSEFPQLFRPTTLHWGQVTQPEKTFSGHFPISILCALYLLRCICISRIFFLTL